MMTLSSSSFGDGQEIPQRHGKKQQNISPELSWTDAPSGTQSFALAMIDTDPVARGYVHWLVVDIDGQTDELPEGSVPPGALELSPYAGPFPPSGTHDYELTLYALDTPRLELPGGPSSDEFAEAVGPHTLGTASLVGTFTKA